MDTPITEMGIAGVAVGAAMVRKAAFQAYSVLYSLSVRLGFVLFANL